MTLRIDQLSTPLTSGTRGGPAKSKPGRAKDNKAFVDAVNERFADFSTWLPQMFPGKTAGEGQSALGVVNSYHDDLINADPDDDTTA